MLHIKIKNMYLVIKNSVECRDQGLNLNKNRADIFGISSQTGATTGVVAPF